MYIVSLLALLTSGTNQENPTFTKSSTCSMTSIIARPGSTDHRPTSSYRHTRRAQFVTIAARPRCCSVQDTSVSEVRLHLDEPEMSTPLPYCTEDLDKHGGILFVLIAGHCYILSKNPKIHDFATNNRKSSPKAFNVYLENIKPSANRRRGSGNWSSH